MKTSEKAREVLDSIVGAFETGKVAPLIAESLLRVPEGMEIPCQRWSMMNRFLCMLNGTVDARGYRQWKTVGRMVRKGVRAFYILVPMVVPDKEKPIGEDGKHPTKVIGFRCSPVFGYEQTDGEPLYGDLEPREPPPLMDVAERLGVKVVYQPTTRGEYGFFDRGRDLISLSSHDPSTFFHELAHAAHHRLKGELKGGQDLRQEAIADLASTALSSMYGVGDYSGNCFEYIQAYCRKEGANLMGVVSEVLEETIEVVELVLGMDCVEREMERAAS